jgi:hypothetical protein
VDKGEVVTIPDVSKGDVVSATDANGVSMDGTREVEKDSASLIDAAARLLRKSFVGKFLDEVDAFINSLLGEGNNASVPPVDGDFSVDIDGNTSILDEVIDVDIVKLIMKIDSVVLVYPFIASALIEGASRGLVLGGDRVKCSLLLVSQRNMDSLHPGKYVMDVMGYFWLAGILRREVISDSNVLPMTMYFYSMLVKEGGLDEGMQGFQKIDIFTKRFIFVPVHE